MYVFLIFFHFALPLSANQAHYATLSALWTFHALSPCRAPPLNTNDMPPSAHSQLAQPSRSRHA